MGQEAGAGLLPPFPPVSPSPSVPPSLRNSFLSSQRRVSCLPVTAGRNGYKPL